MTRPKENPTNIHPLADVQTQHVGDGTRIWQFSVVLPDAVIGRDCNICSHCFVENNVVVGDRVTVKNNVQLWDGIRIHDDVFIGPGVVFTNDSWPRSQKWHEEFPQTKLYQGCSVGANSTVLPGLSIGVGAMVAAGSVVTHDVPPYALVIGNPARIAGFIGTADRLLTPIALRQGSEEIPMRRVKAMLLHGQEDARGDLRFFQGNEEFKHIARVFSISSVRAGHYRGSHAHKRCYQIIYASSGTFSLFVDNGIERKSYRLNTSSVGLLLEAGVWVVLYDFSADACANVVASAPFEAEDYLHDYEEFLCFARDLNE